MLILFYPLLSIKNVDSNSQFNMDVIDYVLRNYQMIDKVGDYEIYQKVS